jgi:hypothetical protein
MSEKPSITPEELRQLLDYDPATGTLTWKPRGREWFNADDRFAAWNTMFAGKTAFTSANVDGRYSIGRIFNKKYFAHRVAWALYHGDWPAGTIDHINHDTRDNRIANLRDVLHAENLKNCGMNRLNSSGHTGVHWSSSRRKWVAQITVSGVNIPLGRYDNLPDAVLVRAEAEARYGFHENHGKDAENLKVEQ